MSWSGTEATCAGGTLTGGFCLGSIGRGGRGNVEYVPALRRGGGCRVGQEVIDQAGVR